MESMLQAVHFRESEGRADGRSRSSYHAQF